MDNGSQSRSRWTCFIREVFKSYYFDSFGGQPDRFPLKQLHKPLIYHGYEI